MYRLACFMEWHIYVCICLFNIHITYVYIYIYIYMTLWATRLSLLSGWDYCHVPPTHQLCRVLQPQHYKARRDLKTPSPFYKLNLFIVHAFVLVLVWRSGLACGKSVLPSTMWNSHGAWRQVLWPTELYRCLKVHPFQTLYLAFLTLVEVMT